MDYGMSQTIIVSNRLPVSVKKTKKGLEFYPSSGGLATGLSSYAKNKRTLWIGWPGIVSDDLTEADEQLIINELKTYHCSPVFLSQKQLNQFYSGYSNTTLWPFLHTLPADFTHETRDWKMYQTVNEQFSDTVLGLSKPEDKIWVHDYQLFLVPKQLRKQRPYASIGFFLHIPFPEAKHYADLSKAKQIVHGLLGADLIGFHTKSYADNFIAACEQLGIGAPAQNGIALEDRVVRVTDFPIGIDYDKFALSGRSRGVQKEVFRLKRKYLGKKIILTVDRMDPTKGFVERLKAYRRLLAQTPELHRKVIMVMLAVPSRSDVAAYQKLKKDVEKLVDSINRTYGKRGWKPVEYRYESVDFDELAALYKIADVGFVAPIRDGMNLVAKEFVASQSTEKGILILSETAGAAEELQEALLVNPSQQRSLVQALTKGLAMPKKEVNRRLKAMQDTLSINTIDMWAGAFMSGLAKATATSRTQSFRPEHLRQLSLAYPAATSRLIILDYDGVLVPFANAPEDAGPTPKLIATLHALAAMPHTTVAVISGRPKNSLEGWLGDLPIVLAAEHGAVIRMPSKKWQTTVTMPDDWKQTIRPILRRYARETPGAFVEEKECSMVWHYRNSAPYYSQKSIASMKQVLRPYLRRFGLAMYRGSKIVEVKSPLVNKGLAVEQLLKQPYEICLILGDDYTDEDMFKAAPENAYTLKIGPGRTAARYRIKNVAQVRELLNSLIS